MTADRHLSTDNFRRLIQSGNPIHHPVAGSPDLILFTDPLEPAVGLRVATGAVSQAPSTGLEHLRTRMIHSEASRWVDVYVTDSRLFADAYPILCAIADRLQLQSMPLGPAITDTVRRLGRLLEHPGRMPIEKELGLFGELLLMWGLLDELDVGTVLGGWTGSEREEHDFALGESNIEVKTTSTERRLHWIESATQLSPTAGRPLWLISQQLTRSGLDGGHTLPGLIDCIRGELVEPGLDTFESGLHKAGWDDTYRNTCSTRWQRRDASKAFLVTATFPRITPDRLHAAGVSMAHIPQLRYRIDLTDQPTRGEPPTFLANAVGRREPGS